MMIGKHIPKWRKHPVWLLLPFLSLLSLGSILLISLISRNNSLPARLGVTPSTSPSPASSVVSPSPHTKPTSSPTLAPSQKQSRKVPMEESKPLTAEQKAQQQEAIAALEASIPTVDSLIEMKVAIEVNISSTSVGVSAESLLLDESGERLDTLSAGVPYTVQASGSSILLDGAALPPLVWVEPPVDGVFYLGDRAYRGRLLLAVENGKLWVVNVVSLRNYLNSVVPSEVPPSWNQEALKAQAVAARSYALTYVIEPVNSLYHLGDDEYFQVYRGVETEANSTRQAVDETAGEFVSYQGGVVESLYAASDSIVAEAFRGKGMSQLGALNLAEQGYTYEQILANYYPETKVGRIAQDY